MTLRFKTPPAFLQGLLTDEDISRRPELRARGYRPGDRELIDGAPWGGAPPPPKRVRKPPIEWSKILLAQLQSAGHVGWRREFRFHGTRQWRFDCAHTALMLAIEVEGMKVAGSEHGGGHRSVKGFREDIEKYGEAFALGWTVLRATTEDVRKGRALRRLEERLALTG